MLNTIFLTLGYMGASLVATMQVPQIYHTVKNETVNDLSLYTLGMNFTAALCMLTYAGRFSLYPIMLANGCITTCDSILLCLYFRYRQTPDNNTEHDIDKSQYGGQP